MNNAKRILNIYSTFYIYPQIKHISPYAHYHICQKRRVDVVWNRTKILTYGHQSLHWIGYLPAKI